MLKRTPASENFPQVLGVNTKFRSQALIRVGKRGMGNHISPGEPFGNESLEGRPWWAWSAQPGPPAEPRPPSVVRSRMERRQKPSPEPAEWAGRKSPTWFVCT